MMNIHNATSALPQPYDRGGLQYSQRSRATLQINESAAISLVTADGDRVTLSAESSLRAKTKTYDFLGRVGDGTLARHGEQSELAAKSSVAISVEGSLDEEELADIQSLLDSLAAARDELSAGDSAAGLEELAQIADLDSIASFDAKLTYSEKLSVRSRTRLTEVEPKPTQAPTNDNANPSQSSAPTLDSLIDQLTQITELLARAQPAAKLPPRIDDLVSKLSQGEPLNRREEQLANHLQSRLAA